VELGPYEKIAFLPPDPLAQRVGSGHFFSTKIYKDHINMFLSKLGYSELVQRIFEKMTFFLVDPLPPLPTLLCQPLALVFAV
jgi:hypothetical protein